MIICARFMITVTMCVTPWTSRLRTSVAASMLPIKRPASTSSILERFLELGRISRMSDEWRKWGDLKNYIHTVCELLRENYVLERNVLHQFLCVHVCHTLV